MEQVTATTPVVKQRTFGTCSFGSTVSPDVKKKLYEMVETKK